MKLKICQILNALLSYTKATRVVITYILQLGSKWWNDLLIYTVPLASITPILLALLYLIHTRTTLTKRLLSFLKEFSVELQSTASKSSFF